MTRVAKPDTSETEIRALLAARAAAVNAADLDEMTAPVADDIIEFDVVGELRASGQNPVREAGKAWLALYEGPPHWEDRDVTICVDGDVAFAHMLSRVTGHRKDGVDVDMWFRTTIGLRRAEGGWRILHEHQSVPFDIDSGKASLRLKP